MSQGLTLYHYWRSSCSWRVRWALAHKNVPFNDIPINLLANEQNSPNYLALNPGGFVPAIEINGAVFGESMAILEWIEETHPSPPLLPASPLDRMRVRQLCHLIVSGIQPLQNLAVMRKHSNDPLTQAAWARYWINAGLEKLESITRTTSGSYSFGGEFTMADVCLMPQIYNAIRFNVDVSNFPNLHRVQTNCMKLSSYEKSAPHNQKGATP